MTLLKIAGLAFLLIAKVSFAGWSMDFENMSNQELYEMHGAIKNAPQADQQAFEVEWEKRVASMTEKEKEEFVEPLKEPEIDDGKLKEPKVPARGYEKQIGPGPVIIGEMPENLL